MPFLKVSFLSFRNLVDNQLDTNAKRVVLIGENGQGKTNFLEALYYLSYGSSFRSSTDAQIFSLISAQEKSIKSFSLEAQIKINLQNNFPPENLKITWTDGSKEIRRDNKKILDRKELIEYNPAIVFCHDDFFFASGDPERRRFFFDQTESLVSIDYIDELRIYKRIIKQRNALLKSAQFTGLTAESQSLLDLLDYQLVEAGIRIMQHRAVLQKNFNKKLGYLYEEVSQLGKNVELQYSPNWEFTDSLEAIVDRLKKKRSDEIRTGSSLAGGPHRDRWTFIVDGIDFSTRASTGQLRLLSLVLRLVQADYFNQVTERQPVLLLDDVLLELDPRKRERFLEILPEAAQAFFTFLPEELLEKRLEDSQTMVYHVERGRFIL